MNRKKFFATITLLSVQCCFGQTPPNVATEKPATEKAQFLIAVDGPIIPFRLDSPIIVNLTVTNISGKEISWEWDRGNNNAVFLAFGFLLMKEGSEVETTVFDRKITGRQRPGDPPEVATSSSVQVSYPPGRMFTIKIDLKQLYEIKEAGLYTLDVSRYDGPNKITVRSNTLTLKIVSQ